MKSSSRPFIVDAHLDLSMNAMDWNRDFTQSIDHIRSRESSLTDKLDRGKGTVSFEELRKGNIGLCFATLIARYVKPKNTLPGWFSPQQAWAHTQGQLAWYKQMEAEGHLTNITDLDHLENHLSSWTTEEADSAIGYILTLEGADSIVSLDHVHLMYEKGLRAIGPAHYGPGTYAFGTDSEGPIGKNGQALLAEMEQCGIFLDVTHLSDMSFWETLESYHGPVWASHSNCRSIVPHQRQFSDEQLKELIQRKAVIGISFDAWMLVPKWERGVSDPYTFKVSLDHVVDHIDYICQLTGNADHVGFGSDLDGGFGKDQCPHDLQTIADLQKLPSLLKGRGYSDSDIVKITSENWIGFLRRNWANES